MSHESVAEAPALLLTLNTAAQMLGVSRRTLERLIAAGEFPRPLKVSSSSRVLAADVHGYVSRLLKARGGAS